MTLEVEERVAITRGQHQEQISVISLVKGLARDVRKIFFALSLGAVGVWLVVGVVLFALFLFAILGN